MSALTKLHAGCYRYRGRYVVRTSWEGPRDGTRWRWETAHDDPYSGITFDGAIGHRTRKEAMEAIDEDAERDGEWLLVPAHMRDDGSGFCSGGEKYTLNGRCKMVCDHAEHYSNDGHPECEDRSGEPGYAAALSTTRSKTTP